MSNRVSNQIVRRCNRQLRQTYGAGGNKCIGTDDPNTLTGAKVGRLAAHGITGKQCVLTVEMGTLGAPVAITLWLWSPIQASWVRAGAASTIYTKTFDSKTIDGWSVPEDTPFYLQGGAEVTLAYTDSNDIAEYRVGG